MPRRPRRAGPEPESDESQQDSQTAVMSQPIPAHHDIEELEEMQRENEDDHVSDK